MAIRQADASQRPLQRELGHSEGLFRPEQAHHRCQREATNHERRHQDERQRESSNHFENDHDRPSPRESRDSQSRRTFTIWIGPSAALSASAGALVLFCQDEFVVAGQSQAILTVLMHKDDLTPGRQEAAGIDPRNLDFRLA